MSFRKNYNVKLAILSSTGTLKGAENLNTEAHFLWPRYCGQLCLKIIFSRGLLVGGARFVFKKTIEKLVRLIEILVNNTKIKFGKRVPHTSLA